VVGAAIGNAMLATAATIGADARVPSMVLQRAPLGTRGSYLATGLNVLQCLGWSVFEITVIAVAAGALCNKLVGVELVWMWKLVFGALGLVLALPGPVGFVRRFVRKIGIWAVAASIAYLAFWILRNGHVGRLWREGGHGGSFWLGAVLVLSHPAISGPTDVLTTVAAGGAASILALLALTVDETDEAFANI